MALENCQSNKRDETKPRMIPRVFRHVHPSILTYLIINVIVLHNVWLCQLNSKIFKIASVYLAASPPPTQSLTLSLVWKVDEICLWPSLGSSHQLPLY